GDGDRSDPVLGRLPVRRQPAGNEVDGNPAAVRRGQREAAERQRQTAAEDLTVRDPHPPSPAGWVPPLARIAGEGAERIEAGEGRRLRAGSPRRPRSRAAPRPG